MSLDRRKFMKITGFASALLAVSGPMLLTSNRFFSAKKIDDLNLDELIAVQFGPSFKLVEMSVDEGAFVAQLESHDNKFIVKSENLEDWKVLSSTVS